MEALQRIHDLQKSFFQSDKTLSIDGRIDKLKKFRQVLLVNEQEIYDALKKDLNKPVLEAFLGEFMGMLHELDTSISKLKKWSRKRPVKSSLLVFPSKAAIVAEPYGQVLIISPWNYPIDLCLSPLIGAIAAGNTAIVKPSRFTPHTAQLIKKMMGQVFDEDYVYVISGGTDNEKLMQMRFDYIFFTGSVAVGKEVMKAASAHLTPVTLELGGKSPVIVSHGYDLKKAAKSIVWGKHFNSGQTCVAPDYVFVHQDDVDEFVSNFEYYSEQFLQNPETDYARIISEKHFDRLVELLSQGEIIYGGGFSNQSQQIFPTLIIPMSMDTSLMQDEIFGPILPVLKYSSKEEIIQFINSREKALVAYIYSSSKNEQQYFITNTSSGSVCVNDTLLNYVNKNLPFGGVGQSGMGKYHGKASFDTFSHYKSVHYKLMPDLPFRYPPYKGKYELLHPFKNILNKNI